MVRRIEFEKKKSKSEKRWEALFPASEPPAQPSREENILKLVWEEKMPPDLS